MPILKSLSFIALPKPGNDPVQTRWTKFITKLSGGTMARIGLRMMPPFPSSPLRCRTAGFPSVRLQSWLVRQGLP